MPYTSEKHAVCGSRVRRRNSIPPAAGPAATLQFVHLERLDLVGFRNCCESVSFDPSLTLILGENNAGKTNVVDALRLVVLAEAGADRLYPRLQDFARDASGNRGTDEFTITAVFADLSPSEQGQLSMALAPSREGYGKARLGVHAAIDADGDIAWHRFGGDFDETDVEQRAVNSSHHTYLPPLRDAGSDLRPGRTNRLARLLQVLTPDVADRDRIVSLAQTANEELAKDAKVTQASNLVQAVLDGMTREHHGQVSDIAFADAEFEALVRHLLARLGESAARDLTESGLGYQNLLYMAVLLAHLDEIEAVPLRVLLVEEPEAHLHPQLQDLLLRFLQESSEDSTGRQVIVTSNSPQFAAAAELDRLVVVTRPRGVTQAAARSVRDIEMSDEERAHVRRFLDVTKASLFFSRGVVLVEGVSEQLLLPHFARLAEDTDLSDSGVTVINIGGVAFRHFARLFGAGGLPIRCAIVSDGDADPSTPDVNDPDITMSNRARSLLDLRSDNVGVFLADVTLEWDLARAQPGDELLVEVMTEVHPVSGRALPDAATMSGPAWATTFRDRLTEKAVFAQELAAKLEKPRDAPLAVPSYLREAVRFVTERQSGSPDGPLAG